MLNRFVPRPIVNHMAMGVLGVALSGLAMAFFTGRKWSENADFGLLTRIISGSSDDVAGQ